MATAPDPSPDPDNQAALNPVTELKEFIKRAQIHLKLTGDLAAIEAKEAGQFAARKATAGIVAGLFGLLFYLLLLAGLTGWLAEMQGWPWFFILFALAGLHLLVALIALIALRRKPTAPFFAETKAQLERDKQCLANPQPTKNKL